MSPAQQTQHFNISAPVSIPATPPKSIVPVRNKTNYQGQIRPVRISLEEVMFTGRVPVSTWSFAFGLHSKLWVSDLTTLYFGKRLEPRKTIFSGKLYVPDRRFDLALSMTAYNSYGDVLQGNKYLHGYVHASDAGHSDLVTLEQDWMSLLFKFRVIIK